MHKGKKKEAISIGSKSWLDMFIKAQPYNFWLDFLCDKQPEPRDVVQKVVPGSDSKKELTRFAEKSKSEK